MLELVERSTLLPAPGEVLIRVEVVPFDRANEAYQRLKSGQAKFRIVLSMLAPTRRETSTRDDDQ